MPQMAPMWWTILFLMFISCFLMTMMMIYFNINTAPSCKQNNMVHLISYNWKW